MPEWSAIRNRPSASAAHRFTIDRHMVEVTSRLASSSDTHSPGTPSSDTHSPDTRSLRIPSLNTHSPDIHSPDTHSLGAHSSATPSSTIRSLHTPSLEGVGTAKRFRGESPADRSNFSCRTAYDSFHRQALLLAGILHDIGKRPGVTDHAAEGAKHARAILRRMGFDGATVDLVTLLVREHMTLSQCAQTRSPAEGGRIVADAVRHDPVVLDMLFDLTRADMCSLGATSGESISGQLGWSNWHAQLVTAMAAAARDAL
ncbi:HD domain-containing protein [Bifidobacterium sp. BRDM6]|uniref:HD domain-containing protein n=2 Tax=Bifidobacterium choloepi TaxID=2614131 RepID=A0A6I5N2I0_9BIFI|nr:HD domain-containing protein [Bifidobacterium choloepi]